MAESDDCFGAGGKNTTHLCRNLCCGPGRVLPCRKATPQWVDLQHHALMRNQCMVANVRHMSRRGKYLRLSFLNISAHSKFRNIMHAIPSRDM